MPINLIVEHSDISILNIIRNNLMLDMKDVWVHLYINQSVKGIEITNEFGGNISESEMVQAKCIIEKHLPNAFVVVPLQTASPNNTNSPISKAPQEIIS